MEIFLLNNKIGITIKKVWYGWKSNGFPTEGMIYKNENKIIEKSILDILLQNFMYKFFKKIYNGYIIKNKRNNPNLWKYE